MAERGDEEQARAEILIDTDVLIEYLRGSPVVRRLIDEIKNGDIKAYFSTITETELYSGSRNERVVRQQYFQLREQFDCPRRLVVVERGEHQIAQAGYAGCVFL